MLQVPGFWLTFLYYFSVTNLIVILVVSQGMGIGFNDRLLYQIAVLLGLIAGLVGAKFNRSVTLSAYFSNKKAFSKILNEILSQMGFEPKSQLEDFIVYDKSSWKTLFTGKIFVQIEDSSATIIGRSSIIKKLSQVI
ncbi:hypothetical protein IQ238_23435 [Pleurocapsales cyanobacterium LEGE 06147]|nr:hypothetical protein [Pleurocapsales cyanobacterium LEGE 06147]